MLMLENRAATKRCSPLSQDTGSKRLCTRGQEPSEGHGAGPPKNLVLEYWDRTDECLERKWTHMELVDRLFASREELILATTLAKEETVLEPNMFPYDTPDGIEHWTLWSRHEMDGAEIEEFVGNWLKENPARVESWNFDENLSRSIDVFHVHVYFKGPRQSR
jgi:hypothetical protein